MFTDSAVILDKPTVRRSLERHLLQATGIEPEAAEPRDWLYATAAFARSLLLERWANARRNKEKQGAKEACYFSMEFLIGRLLMDTLRSLGIHEVCSESLAEVGCSIEEVAEQEPDAGLGNGGLGRLAACLLDSTAAVGVPAYGYGIRYEFGMFAQRIEQGWQSEEPEPWLRFGGPWEFPRPDLTYPVRFHGRVDGNRWIDATSVLATAFDVPVPGYKSDTVNTLRLWSARARRELDLRRFNEGDHLGAVGEKAHWESLTRVLYPHDGTPAGRELRFKQQYFFVSASLQDILARMKRQKRRIDDLPDFIAVQINDTHPAISVAELMRLLVDENGLDWSHAWDITRRTISYTNHTLMPEALETWPLQFFERMLPRHLQIIYRINELFLAEVAARHPGDVELLRRVSFIDEQGERRVRMAHLAFVGSHAVNGVSKIHTALMRQTVFADFDRLLPRRIVNITNGIAPRRWLAQINPSLSRLVASCIGEGWMRDLGRLQHLAPLAGDSDFQARFRAAKEVNKARLANYILDAAGIGVDPRSLFDVQIKRIHEYKRQVLKLLHAITLYNRIRRDPAAPHQPRTIIFAGKAAPGYAMAKLVIKLINDVARAVNGDPMVGDRLKVLFLPNYGVTLAERIIPAADLSEQISTAGTEASGTGNMKMALNGALTIGTLDGANIEIRDAAGSENFFAFGLETPDVARMKEHGYDPMQYVNHDSDLQEILGQLASGVFSPDQRDLFHPVVQSLTRRGEQYCVLADFRSYLDAQDAVDRLYPDRMEWTRRAILNVASMGAFSSDRAILDYSRQVWGTRTIARDQD
ncbi:MAG TPA: glycogen/starch/alpha-glucan phosphorylase [Dongiaceae bacterium]|nr:glycogen/starch/alpha-glucan phosphorylase [Dongiaceae bacterium]